MRTHFDFKSLLEKISDLSIPKEFIYFGIGAVLVILLGMIASNMYLQDMLLFEGAEKSIQMFTEEELREYGAEYKELTLDLQDEIASMIQDFANRTNRAGERIHFGIFNREHPMDDTRKIIKHSNGENVNKTEGPVPSEFDDSINDFTVKASYLDTDEFRNGVKIKYAKTEGRADGESNYKDILTVVSMILDQKHGGINGKDLKVKVPELIKKLFEMSHTYSGETSELYSCKKGCRLLFYYCNEIDSKYKNTGIDLQPFEINPHSDFEDYDYSDEDLKLLNLWENA